MASSLNNANVVKDFERFALEVNADPSCVENLDRCDLLPSFFRIRGEPYSLENYPQFKEMYGKDWVPDTLFVCGRQTSKSLCENTLCRFSNGLLKKLKAINVNDEMLSCDEYWKIHPRHVINKYDHGVQPVWRVHTRLGGNFACTMDHRLQTITGEVPLKLLKVGSRIAAPRCGGIFTGTAKIPHARIMLTAYMIGDGCCTKKYQYTFTSACDEVLKEFVACFPNDCTCSNKKNTVAKAIRIHVKHPLYAWLKEDRLHGHYSYNKFLPDWVFDLSKKDTILFLARLWATDGCITQNRGFPAITYSSASELLAYQTKSLLNKLKILVSIKKQKTQCNGKICRPSFELRVEGLKSQKLFLKLLKVPGKPAVAIPTTQANSNRDTVPLKIYELLKSIFQPYAYRRAGNSMRAYPYCDLRIKPKYPPTYEKLAQYLDYARWAHIEDPNLSKIQDIIAGDITWDKIVSIEYEGLEQTYDLEIETDHNYIAGGVITHNSTNLSRSEVLNSITIPHLQTLYVAPLQSQAQRYSNLYLNEAINSCYLAKYLQQDDSAGLSDSPILKSVFHKAFANGAGIQLTYAKTSSDRARGIFADVIDFDEIQDQLTDNIPIVSESLTASDYGIRRFTGTARTTDNTIEALWQDSSMSEWAMKCSHCNHWNIPNLEGGILKMIQSDGVHCAKCGQKLNVREGIWVPAHPDRMGTFKGFHIPQIIVPAIVEHPSKWGQLIRKLTRWPVPVILQEILGISCSVGARLITQADIDKYSTLPSVVNLQKKLKDYVFTVGGVDWGVAEQTSFTVHTIIGIKPDGQIHVLWAKRFMGFDPDELLQAIAHAHRFYNCRMIACDFGMGFDKNIMLEQRFGLTVIQMAYTQRSTLLHYTPFLGHHRWSVDKVTALELMFLAIKYGKILFPPKAEFDIYTGDLLSPYEELIESGGMTHRRFLRNPTRADDFCHALCFASLLAMRLMNSDIINIVPAHAMGNDKMPGDGAAPTLDHLDPRDLMTALNI